MTTISKGTAWRAAKASTSACSCAATVADRRDRRRDRRRVVGSDRSRRRAALGVRRRATLVVASTVATDDRDVPRREVPTVTIRWRSDRRMNHPARRGNGLMVRRARRRSGSYWGFHRLTDQWAAVSLRRRASDRETSCWTSAPDRGRSPRRWSAPAPESSRRAARTAEPVTCATVRRRDGEGRAGGRRRPLPAGAALPHRRQPTVRRLDRVAAPAAVTGEPSGDRGHGLAAARGPTLDDRPRPGGTSMVTLVHRRRGGSAAPQCASGLLPRWPLACFTSSGEHLVR